MWLVRGRFHVIARTATNRIKAAGRSQEILGSHFRTEQARQPGRAPLPRRAPGASTHDAAALVPGDPAKAVVTEDKVEQVVVLRAPYIGAVGGGCEHNGRHPPASGDHHCDGPDG